MRILPYERFTIQSPLPVDELTHRLRSGVAPVRFSLRRPAQPFQGSVHGDRFVIHRVLGYRNSFRPEITGRVVPAGGGSTIEVSMALHPVILAFMGFWLTIAALVFVGFGIAVVSRAANARDVGVFPFLFLPFGLAVCTIGFRIEANRTKQALYRLVGAVAA
ncbi:hypothetical protein [Rhizocola hellebori]|nr:hypothetical protein [Rhizocola hellebori]